MLILRLVFQLLKTIPDSLFGQRIHPQTLHRTLTSSLLVHPALNQFSFLPGIATVDDLIGLFNQVLDNIELLLLEDDIDIEKLNLNFHIHCDIGHNGKTRELIKEITNWVESYGYDCLIKPESYTASGIANKFSK